MLGWTLTVLLREWRARVEEIARDLPQGVRGYQVLSAATHGTPPTQAALAARLGIDRTVMTYLLDAFEGCDLLRREPDPNDRRARRVVPTDHGRRILADLDEQVSRTEEDLLRDLAPEERTLLLTLLERAASATSPESDRCTEVLDPPGPRS
ncbi:MarR family transcriptional regulator [Actinocorallia aurea]